MVDLFLLIVDRDCNRDGNEQRAHEREREHLDRLIACLAREEVEVWMLALHASELPPFGEIRASCDPKEQFAKPFLEKRGTAGPGGGRKGAMRALTGQWRSLRDRCDELKVLQQRIETWLASSARS